MGRDSSAGTTSYGLRSKGGQTGIVNESIEDTGGDLQGCTFAGRAVMMMALRTSMFTQPRSPRNAPNSADQNCCARDSGIKDRMDLEEALDQPRPPEMKGMEAPKTTRCLALAE